MRRNFALLFFLLLFSLSVFAISGPEITSPAHPDPEKWYKIDSPSFDFNFSGASGYSFEFDRFPDTVPDTVSDSSLGEASFQNKDNGEWFFHVIARVGGQWTDPSHYNVKIDKFFPTAALNVKATPIDTSSIQLSWEPGTDSHSGVKGYKIYRGFLTGFSITDESTVIVSPLVEGASFVDSDVSEGVYYHYKLQTIDNVGNSGGVSREVISKTASACDLTIAFQEELTPDRFDLNVLSDDIFFGASLDVTLPGSERDRVFSNISGKALFESSFGLSDVPPGKILAVFTGEDAEGDDCSAEKEFFIDFVDPVVSWVSPIDNQFLADVVQLQASVSDGGQNPSGISSVEFFYEKDGLQKIGDGVLSGAVYVFDWNTLLVPNARYPLVVRVADFAGNSAEDEITVTLKNTVIISAEAFAAISSAVEKRAEAVEFYVLLKSIGVESLAFQNFFTQAETGLSSAKLAFERGVNFERAIIDAESSFDDFSNALSSVEVSKDSSIAFSYSGDSLQAKLERAGVRRDFVERALDNFSSFGPLRRIDFYKIVDANKTFFKALAVVSFDGPDENAVQVVEVLPVGLSLSAGAGVPEIDSNFSFRFLGKAVLFEGIDLNQANEFLYVFSNELSKAETISLARLEKEELFPIPPLVFPLGESLPQDLIVSPVDLFREYGSLFEGLDLFSAVLLFGGIVIAASFALALISFAVIAFVVIRTRGRRKGLGS